MATSNIALTEGSGAKKIATYSISEDATTKELQRIVLVDQNGVPYVTGETEYSVTGSTSAVVAASLAANSALVTLRNGASKKLYFKRLRVDFTPATVGTSALVAGSIAWQRFTAATPSGGTARTVARKRTSYAASTVADVRDSNGALTVTSVVFGDILAETKIPLMTTGGLFTWEILPQPGEMFVLEANEGLALRTTVICPATQTWMYAYLLNWDEKTV